MVTGSTRVGSTLTDRHGTWCGKCFDYIKHEMPERHHIVSQQWIRNFFGEAFPLGPTVPVHRTGSPTECHTEAGSGIQNFTDGLSGFLCDFLNEEFNFATLDRV